MEMALRIAELQFHLRWKIADAGIRNRQVLDAIEAIPRAEFVSTPFKPQAYDLDFPIPAGHGQRMNLLLEDALIAQELGLCGNELILEVGTGTGYLTVVLADLSNFVVTIERNPDLSRTARYNSKGRKNIEYLVGDGALGCPDRAPFDRIVISAAVTKPPMRLVEQMRPGGFMLLPLVDGDKQILTRVQKTLDGQVVPHSIQPCQFSPLIEVDE